jgi:hypothetical protein
VVTRWVVLLPLIGLLSACAAVLTGPSVMVLPGAGRALQWRYDVSYMQCMYAKGNQLLGTPTAPQSSYVPPPPGTPPPPSAAPRPPATVPPPR